MKNVLIFIIGVVVGVTVSVRCLDDAMRVLEKDYGVVLSEQGKKTLSMRKLKVFHVIDKEGALVQEGGIPHKIEEIPQIYFLLHDEQDLYYDNQEISVAKGMKVKQVGVYRYKNRADMILTVPAIRIESMKTENK